jgi:hypothetical protein
MRRAHSNVSIWVSAQLVVICGRYATSDQLVKRPFILPKCREQILEILDDFVLL